MTQQHPSSAAPVDGSLPVLVIVAGPTASGKSHLALRIADAFHGEIVNADSLQLYRGFDIGTAKTPASERASIPHHLIDVLEAGTVYSAGDFARYARQTVAEIAARGRLPILTGGTGFYIQAFLDGLPALPPRDEILRQRLTSREQRRPGSLFRILQRLEPASAERILPADLQKQIRALELRLLTGSARPPQHTGESLQGFRVLQLGLAPDRQELAGVIHHRTEQMFHQGLIAEVRALLAGGLTGQEKPFEAIGYKQALQQLRGELTLEQAVESVEIETRQYAKRQRTWFRRDTRIEWLEGFGTEPSIIRAALTRVAAMLT